ncbi:MAG: NAD(P)/FAD-dependent oxidoreductase, partial [Oscillospiraceae bacterium]
LDETTLDNRILKEIQKNINKNFSNVIRSLLPAKAVDVFLEICNFSDDLKANQVTKEQRQSLIKLLKAFPLTFKKFRPIDEAIITSGGICVKEINPKTMESKIVNGLYFCGEIIDVDAFTGGFNLQIAFSTANSAIESIW